MNEYESVESKVRARWESVRFGLVHPRCFAGVVVHVMSGG